MSKGGDGKTDLAEWFVLIVIFVAGISILIWPGPAPLSDVAELTENYPNPSDLGPHGQLVGLLGIVSGVVGAYRKKV